MIYQQMVVIKIITSTLHQRGGIDGLENVQEEGKSEGTLSTVGRAFLFFIFNHR